MYALKPYRNALKPFMYALKPYRNALQPFMYALKLHQSKYNSINPVAK